MAARRFTISRLDGADFDLAGYDARNQEPTQRFVELLALFNSKERQLVPNRYCYAIECKENRNAGRIGLECSFQRTDWNSRKALWLQHLALLDNVNRNRLTFGQESCTSWLTNRRAIG